ncbi:MAG: GGDEF domain-containing protein [Parvibaculum sp.]
MKHARLSATHHIPSKTDGLLFAFDEATERFRNFASDARHVMRPSRLVAGALRYAEEVEQRILALNARVAHLESLAITDELTGLLNRRGFAGVMQRNLLSAARYDEGGILAYIDLDDFKGTNDRYGHKIGDMVLKNVGRYLQQNVRATDYAARLGGDEFTILFVRAEHEPARERAHHLIRGLNSMSVKSPEGEISIRASIGIAHYDGSTDMDDLLDRADKAMYADKNNGSRAVRLSAFHG